MAAEEEEEEKRKGKGKAGRQAEKKRQGARPIVLARF
jgi:hypothetical protein